MGGFIDNLIMKTYTKIEKRVYPRLIIKHDQDAENPRIFQDCIGHFFTNERNYKSPDGNDHELYSIMMDTADDAESSRHHIKLMRATAQKLFTKTKDESVHVIDIYPVYRYEHSCVAYKRGTAHGFDYSNCGFYFVTAASIEGETLNSEQIEKLVDLELQDYTAWVNGEVYEYLVKDKNGEDVDGWRGGYLSLEDIAMDLAEQGINDFAGEDLEDYLVA